MKLPEDCGQVIQKKVRYYACDGDGNGVIAVQCGRKSYQKEFEYKGLFTGKIYKKVIAITDTVWYNLPDAIIFHNPENSEFIGFFIDPYESMIRFWYSKKKV